jgi:hypothetical protein
MIPGLIIQSKKKIRFIVKPEYRVFNQKSPGPIPSFIAIHIIKIEKETVKLKFILTLPGSKKTGTASLYLKVLTSMENNTVDKKRSALETACTTV